MRLEQGARRVPVARGQSRAQARVGRRCRPAAAARFALAANTCARPAPRRARCWSPPRRSAGTCRPPNAAPPRASSRMPRAGARLTLWRGRGGRGQAGAAERGQAQGPEELDADRRRRRSGSTSADKVTGQADLRHRRSRARHALRGDRAVPGVRRQRSNRSTSRRSAAEEAFGKVVALPDAVAVVADSWWQAKNGARGAAGDLGRREERRRFRAPSIAELLRAGLAAPEGGNRPQGRRCRCGARQGGKARRGGICRAVPQPRDDGAAELHGACDARQGRNLGADAERRSRPGRGGRGRRSCRRRKSSCTR